MLINRRNFLAVAGGAVAVTTTALNDKFGLAAAPRNSADSLPNWEHTRQQFDRLAPDFIHLSSFFLASHPRSVHQAIEEHQREIDRNPFLYVEQNIMTRTPQIQASAAAYLGVRAEEVGLTNSTTMGLAFIYQGLPLLEGQEILTTAHDHFVHHEAIRLAAVRAGATVKKVALFDNLPTVSNEEMVIRLVESITSKTRIVGVTWVHSGTGLKIPVRMIAEALAKINQARGADDQLLLVVDGVHGFGVEDETVAEMGADFFISGTHKWLFGPRGTGIIWAKAENWQRLRLTFPAFARETVGAWMTDTEPKTPTQAGWISPGGFQAFEYHWALPAAFEFHQKIGRRAIAERIHALNTQCKEGLAKMPHVKLYTPRADELSAGLICFDVEGRKPEEVVSRLLEKKIVASSSPYRNSCARVAPSLLNTPAEIEITLRHIRELA